MNESEIIKKITDKTKNNIIKWTFRTKRGATLLEFPVFVTNFSTSDTIELSEFKYADDVVAGVTWIGLRMAFVNSAGYPYKTIIGERNTSIYDQLEKLYDLINLKINNFDSKIINFLGEPEEEELTDEDYKILKAMGFSDKDIDNIKKGKKITPTNV